MRKGLIALGMVGLTFATSLAVARNAQAQTARTPVRAFPQGMVGTGLLGAEAVVLVEGAVGVRNRWLMLGTAAVGLIGGGVGGYFIDQAIDSNPRSDLAPVSTGLLVVGIGLVIPATIMYLSATNYRPEDNAAQDDNSPGATPLEESGASSGNQPSAGGPPAGSGDAGGSSAAGGGGGNGTRHPRRRYYGPEALLNLTPGQFRVGVPMVSVGGSYSLEEMHHWGVGQTSEWRVPVFSAYF